MKTGERPYGCRYCWKAFADGGTLRKHERIHTGKLWFDMSVSPLATSPLKSSMFSPPILLQVRSLMYAQCVHVHSINVLCCVSTFVHIIRHRTQITKVQQRHFIARCAETYLDRRPKLFSI